MPGIGLGLSPVFSAGRPVVFQLLDRFVTAESAPIVSPRAAEPGPGQLTVVQNDGQFAIAGGALIFPAQTTPAWGDLGLRASDPLARAAGLAMLASINISSAAGNGCFLGWTHSGLDFADIDSIALWLHASGDKLKALKASGSGPDLGDFAIATDYQLALVLRSAGLFLLIKGGSFSDWTLLWVHDSGIGASLTPAFSNQSQAGALDDLRAARLGAPWTGDNGIATDQLAGIQENATNFTHEADCLITYEITQLSTSGTMTVAIRALDDSNNWQVRVSDTSGDLELREVVAGVATTRGSAAGAVASGSLIQIIADDERIRVFVDDVEQIDYASAANFKSETTGQIVMAGNGALSDLSAWPRTLSGAARTELELAS